MEVSPGEMKQTEVLNAIWMLVDVEWNHVNLRGASRRPIFSPRCLFAVTLGFLLCNSKVNVLHVTSASFKAVLNIFFSCMFWGPLQVLKHVFFEAACY